MLGRGLIALAVAGASAFLLFNDAGDPAPPLAVAKAKPPVLTLDRPVGGTLYFSAFVPNAGGDATEAVYRLAPGDPRPVKVLPGDARTWHVSAWGEHVVVNTERIGKAVPRAFDLQAGHTIATDAHLPVAGPGGRVAYGGYVQGGTVSAAFVRWSARGRFRPIVRAGIWSTAFLPDGRLVVVQRRDGRAWILVIDERGVQRELRVPGNPQHHLLVTSGGLIGYEGGTGTLRVYTPSGKRRAAIDVEGWNPAGTRGDDFLLIERDRARIATLTPAGDLEIVGRHDPDYAIFNLEWELG